MRCDGDECVHVYSRTHRGLCSSTFVVVVVVVVVVSGRRGSFSRRRGSFSRRRDTFKSLVVWYRIRRRRHHALLKLIVVVWYAQAVKSTLHTATIVSSR